jgi:hydroxymethylpyrimidine/phosphomethylpyrimidine kinase
MVATSGARLIAEDAVEALTEKLLPLAAVVTPNIPEAEILSGRAIRTPEDMAAAAEVIRRRLRLRGPAQGRPQRQRRQRFPAVRGGGREVVLRPPDRQPQHPRHRLHPLQRHRRQSGQGLRSAETSVQRAKDYLSGALAANAGSGPRAEGP